MYKFAVCDDEVIICSNIEKIILSYGKKNFMQFDVGAFYSGEDLCSALDKGEYFDLIFLDIEMSKINGVEIGKKIRDELKNETTQIIYISTHSSYAMELFKIRPMDFLIKPVKSEEIAESIDKMMELVKKTCKIFKYTQGRDELKRELKDILYFKSVGRLIVMVTITGEEFFNYSLKRIYEELKQNGFFYADRSCLVNYNHVIEFKYCSLLMSNREEIEIAQLRRQEVRRMQVTMEREGL